MDLMAFFAVRGVPPSRFGEISEAEFAFLQGSRALYYDEQIALMREAMVEVINMVAEAREKGGG